MILRSLPSNTRTMTDTTVAKLKGGGPNEAEAVISVSTCVTIEKRTGLTRGLRRSDEDSLDFQSNVISVARETKIGL